MELPLVELNPKEYKEWKDYAFKEWGRLLRSIINSDYERYKNI